MKEGNRNYPTTVKWTYEEMIQLQLRASALGVTRAEYLRLKGLEPIGRIKKTQEQNRTRQAIAQSAVITYTAIVKELNRQGINLNQITRAINSGKLEGRSIEHCLEDIAEIKRINQEILESIAHLRASS